jgi:CheY-like chemotaxis protein
VVDDEATMRNLISTALSGAGADVVSTASADEAFTQLSEQPFDVLVSDIAMPLEDGHSLARRIRARNDEVAHIPAVALTAYGGPLQKQLALEAGFDDYLKKPFAPQDLIETIAKVVHKDEPPSGDE